MKKVFIDSDEWYPVYSMRLEGEFSYGTPAKVSDKVYARYKQVMEEFEKLQEIMIKLAKGS